MRLPKTESFCAWLVLCSCCVVSAGSSTAQMRSDFRDPPVQYWPRPLWFWNDTEVTAPGVL